MANLKINNISFDAPEGLTVLEVAEKAGFKIPVLCSKPGVEHYSSCMVCMVKDQRSNSYIPACSSLVQDGMDLDVSGTDVIELRKKAVELLLSEHRAECEAPCRIVCPAGYNIPLMNRLLSAGAYDEVYNLTVAEIKSGIIQCVDCQGYCENACRRKKVDIPISIRNIKLFIYELLKAQNRIQIDENTLSTEKKQKQARPFSSHLGKLEQTEFNEWLKECPVEADRFREITELKNGESESKSCMHCDCRAANDCRLRDIAGELSVKDPRGKLVNSPIVKKINYSNGLIFENAKCIKCGLCVRVCEDSKEEPALCFINRGFVSIISEPLTEEFGDILKTQSDKVVEICPTGALSKLK
jgi:predicted molibdopterin-dependent oxidoreductase YjgC